MRVPAWFYFWRFLYPATVRSGLPFCSIILIMVFCLYQMLNLLATIGELLRLERRPLNQIIVP